MFPIQYSLKSQCETFTEVEQKQKSDDENIHDKNQRGLSRKYRTFKCNS